MNLLELVARVAFWGLAALVCYSYLGYPLLVRCLAACFGRRQVLPELSESELPSLSLLIVAYNEELVLRERLENALALDYPKEKFDVVVASDGSCDGTAGIVRQYQNRGVRLLDYSPRRGKAAVLNAAFPELTGEVVLLSDANTHMDRAAARRIARWFQDPATGVVCGRLVLTDPQTGRNVDSLYWKYEISVKRCEASLGALLGANGAIYAVRKGLFTPIAHDTIVEDLVIPLFIRLRTGCAIVYDGEAVAHEETPAHIRCEFHRRARIGAGGFQSMALLWRLLDPRQGWAALAFLSHKVLRWLCPFFLLALLASNLVLVREAFYGYCLLAQLGFYMFAVVAACLPGAAQTLRFARLATMFTTMNLAILVGFWRWLRGSQKGTWRRTARAQAGELGEA